MHMGTVDFGLAACIKLHRLEAHSPAWRAAASLGQAHVCISPDTVLCHKQH